MKLNRTDLKKIMYDFNSISNRLMQANFNDHTGIVRKYVAFIKATPIIYDYIIDCGPCEQDMEEEFKMVGESYGRCIFELGDTTEEEVRNVFAILDYIAEKGVNVCHWIASGYTDSTKFQDRVRAFNDRVTMVLIRHIERYLTKVGIDMGLDDNTQYNISVNHGQVNIATDNATITATNNMGIDYTHLEELINEVKDKAIGFNSEEKEALMDSLEVIEEQAKSNQVRKSLVRTAITTLKGLKGTVEFIAAIAALVQFVQPLL